MSGIPPVGHPSDGTRRATPRFAKLVALLKELFQLDRPDLDFGFYRIMHAKSADVTKFLEQELLPQVHAALHQYESADRRAVDVQALEAEVYDHLYGFFRRYYSDGDFISKRVYKPGVYAIPYEGEEVKLHWANSDQYYIKTDEYLRDYAFRLQPANHADPMRVHFRLADAAEGEHGNIKEVAAKKRVFLLRNKDFLREVEGKHGKELVVRFEYRPPRLSDWPDDRRAQQKKPPSQKELLGIAEERLSIAGGSRLARWIKALVAPHIGTSGEPTDKSRFRIHLNRYTARNTFDYFIHRDLGTFLRRELDFYIKNEVMHLDDIDSQPAAAINQYLSKVKIVRRIASKVIDFLSQLEDFQKKLWVKKKFVVETSYCIRLGCIPRKYWPDILDNNAQRQEWTTLLSQHRRSRLGLHPIR